MKTVSLYIAALAFLLFASTANAWNPDEPNYTPPVDSIVVWFHDYCNQHQQARAFWHITKPEDWRSELRMVELDPNYDTQAVKDAFVYFVGTLSYNKGLISSCAEFYADWWIGPGEDNTKSDYWDGRDIGDLVLSLYMNLGYSDNLYLIADSLYSGDPQTMYFVYLWNQLGTGYFQHLQSIVQGSSPETYGIRIANEYLKTSLVPRSDEMKNAALDIINAAANSTVERNRFAAAQFLTSLYISGYTTVKPDIENLLQDSSPKVQSSMKFKVKSRQAEGYMMSFDAE